MKNKFPSLSKLATGLAFVAAIAGTTKDALAQNLANRDTNAPKTENTNGVASNANSLAYTDPLDFTQQNIQNYFPDQESVQQANFLINRLGRGTIRNQINQLLIENIVNNISDPKQQIRTIVFALERYLFLGDKDVENIFSKNNQSREISNFRAALNFNTAFNQRIKENIEQMIKDIEQGKKDIEQGKKDIEQGKKDIEQGKKDIEQGKNDIEQGKKDIEQGRERIKKLDEDIEQGRERIKKLDEDIEQGRKEVEKGRLEVEKMMEFITPDMVKSDPNIRNIITRRQQRYKNLEQTPTNPHIISLFNALK